MPPSLRSWWGYGNDDALFGSFFSVWAGPHPESTYDREEFWALFERLREAGFPEEVLGLEGSAVEMDLADPDAPADGVAIRVEDEGWMLAYPDRVLRFVTAVVLLDWLLERRG